MGDGDCPGSRLAMTAALNPPAPVPQKTSGAGVPSAVAHLPSYIAFKTPTSYAALAPPPESTRPTRWFEFRKHPLDAISNKWIATRKTENPADGPASEPIRRTPRNLPASEFP